MGVGVVDKESVERGTYVVLVMLLKPSAEYPESVSRIDPILFNPLNMERSRGK